MPSHVGPVSGRRRRVRGRRAAPGREGAPAGRAACRERRRRSLDPAASRFGLPGSVRNRDGTHRPGNRAAPSREAVASAQLHKLRSALCALRSALCALRSALCALRSALCALRSRRNHVQPALSSPARKATLHSSIRNRSPERPARLTPDPGTQGVYFVPNPRDIPNIFVERRAHAPQVDLLVRAKVDRVLGREKTADGHVVFAPSVRRGAQRTGPRRPVDPALPAGGAAVSRRRAGRAVCRPCARATAAARADHDAGDPRR